MQLEAVPQHGVGVVVLHESPQARLVEEVCATSLVLAQFVFLRKKERK